MEIIVVREGKYAKAFWLEKKPGRHLLGIGTNREELIRKMKAEFPGASLVRKGSLRELGAK